MMPGSWRVPLLALSCLVAPPSWAQEPAAPAAPESPEQPVAGEARAYLGFGLSLVSHTLSTPGGDIDSSGGGLVLNGALHSRPVNPSLDIALRGAVAGMGREFDNGGPETGDVLVEMDGGLRISQMFLLTLGYTTQVIAYESPEVAFSYNVYPIGVGVFHATDSGYLLGQVRLGGGRLANDQNDDTERVGYFGLRAVVQHGSPEGVQFMGAIGFDSYDVDDTGETEDFFRLEFGLGFGL